MRHALIAALIAVASPVHAYDPGQKAADLAAALAESRAAEEAELNALRASVASSMATITAEARKPVQDRLADACVALYATEPDRTITNPLCYEVFISQGLPD